MKLSYDRHLAALVLLAFVGRFWGAMAADYFLGDEVVHVPAAVHFVKEGRFIYHWVHPPMNHLLTYGGMLLFGDNPYGWRMLYVLFGSLSVGILVAVGKRLFSDKRAAYLAGALMAVEPLNIIMSRTNFMEIATIFFFLCGVYGTLRYLEDRRRSLFWVGIVFGLTMAEKWYFLLPLLTLAAYTVFSLRAKASALWQEGIYLAFSFFIVPAIVYLAAFTPWFRMGHDVEEFFQLQIDMYRQLQAFRIDNYLGSFVRFMPSTSPWNWFVMPLISASPINASDKYAKFMIIMNNFPVWFFAIPACLWSIYTIIRERNKPLLLMLMLFLVSYGQFAVVNRPLFLYTATAVLPFLYLLISFFIVDIMRRITPSPLPYRLVIFLVIAWGIYLYPFITGRVVPVELYTPLLKLVKPL